MCLCEFELYWIDGPRKGKKDKVGCDKVCFLSPDRPEDDPMISTWLRELAAEEQKSLKSTAPKDMKLTRASPSPSPSLEPAPSKKQVNEPSLFVPAIFLSSFYIFEKMCFYFQIVPCFGNWLLMNRGL